MACHTYINSGASRGTPPVPPHEPFAKRSLTFTLAVLIQTLQTHLCSLFSAMVYYTGIWESAREPEEESREEREHLCNVTPPYFTQNSTSDLYFLKRNDSIIEESRRLREKSVSSRGKVRSYTSLLVFFNRILLGRARTFVMLHFRVFDSFSSLFFFRLMRWTDSSAARRGSLCVLQIHQTSIPLLLNVSCGIMFLKKP